MTLDTCNGWLNFGIIMKLGYWYVISGYVIASSNTALYDGAAE